MSPELLPPEAEETAETDESRLKRFDRRIEEWLTSLRDEANERSPEVLSAMAAKTKDLAQYLEKMADQARAKRTSPGTSDDPPAVAQGTAANESASAEDQRA